MSKLSPALKSLISAAHARPGPIPAPPRIQALYSKIRDEAVAHKLGPPSWLGISTAATMTMNSPDSMATLYAVAAGAGAASTSTVGEKDKEEAVAIAEFMREVGLKCIGFNGIPRTINMLNAFRASLPPHIPPHLSTTPTRLPTPTNISETNHRGRTLWNAIYAPLADKLEHKLGEAHPDLPVFIINSEYGGLFTDPEEKRRSSGGAKSGSSSSGSSSSSSTPTTVGRLTTSLVAISCLRAQQGVGPQVLSHVFGLRKAWDDGSWKGERGVGEEEGVRWLVSDEGCMWVLDKVDEVVEALGGGGSTFAPVRAKL